MSFATRGRPDGALISPGSERVKTAKVSASTLNATPFSWATIGLRSLVWNSASVVLPPSAEIWSGPPSTRVAQKS
jgi:hypothetical protein